MPTIKEALCLLAVVVAIFTVYRITGRTGHEDTLLMAQVRQQGGADCILPLAGDEGPPEAGFTEHPPGPRPIKDTRPDEPCVPDTASEQLLRLTRH